MVLNISFLFFIDTTLGVVPNVCFYIWPILGGHSSLLEIYIFFEKNIRKYLKTGPVARKTCRRLCNVNVKCKFFNFDGYKRNSWMEWTFQTYIKLWIFICSILFDDKTTTIKIKFIQKFHSQTFSVIFSNTFYSNFVTEREETLFSFDPFILELI